MSLFRLIPLVVAAVLVPLTASATLRPTAPPIPGGRAMAILRPCPSSQLHAVVSSDTGAMMHRELRITLTNVGARACAIDGYPAVRLLDAQKRARIAAESFSGSPRQFIIAPHQRAAFELRIATGDGTTNYLTIPFLGIIPPGDVSPLFVKVELPSAPTVEVTALEPVAESK
jgi:hypothetical protein